jgi:hypothetical protein
MEYAREMNEAPPEKKAKKMRNAPTPKKATVTEAVMHNAPAMKRAGYVKVHPYAAHSEATTKRLYGGG